MASKSETGHAKNVANFQALIEVVKTMHKYKPNSERFTVPGLEAKYQSSLGSTNALNKVGTAFGNLITDRQNLFAPLPQLATRVLNGLADTEASEGFKKDAATIARKIHGRRATPKKKEPDTPEAGAEPLPKTISTSQLSFDSLVEHYRKLVELLSTEPTYKQADETISLPGLQALLQKMETVNKAAKEAEATFGEHLRPRNEMLYEEKTGMCDIALEVKKPVRSAYGSRSPEARAVSAIKFKQYAKNKI
jgi:hypothetical protein